MIIGRISGSRLSIALNVDGMGTQEPRKGKWRLVRLNTRSPSNITKRVRVQHTYPHLGNRRVSDQVFFANNKLYTTRGLDK